MPDLWPVLALTAASLFFAASVITLLTTLRAAQFRAEEEQFPFLELPEMSDVARTVSG